MFCTNCGKELLDGAKFCSACGARVEADVVDSTISYVSDKPSFEEDAPVKRPVTNKVVFDWSNVIDEPLKKETANVESPWVSEKPAKTPEVESFSKSAPKAETEKEPGKIRFTDDDSFLAELGKPSSDSGRTMSFIDILKQEREEREQNEAKSLQSEEATMQEHTLKTPEDAYSDYLNARGTADEEKAQHDYEETVRAAAPKIYEPEEIKIREFVAPEALSEEPEEPEETDDDLVEIDFSEPEVEEPSKEEEAPQDDFVIETLEDEEDEEPAEEPAVEEISVSEPEEVEEQDQSDDFEVEYEGDDDDDDKEEEPSIEEMPSESEASSDSDDSYDEQLNFDYLTMDDSEEESCESEEEESSEAEDYDDHHDESSDDDDDDDDEDEDDDDEVEEGKHGRSNKDNVVVAPVASEENVESEIEALKRRLAELLGEDEEEIEIPKKETVSIEEIAGPSSEEPVSEADSVEVAEEPVADAACDITEEADSDEHTDFVSVTVADLLGEDVATAKTAAPEVAEVAPADEEKQAENDELDQMLADLLGDIPEEEPKDELIAEAIFPEESVDAPVVEPEPVAEVEPELVAPVEEETDAMTIEELERDLFGDDFTSEDADAEATKKIDRFYTLYKKNEEFQQLLNDEYNKLNNPDLEDDEDLFDIDSLLAENEADTSAVSEPVAEEVSAKAPVAETAEAVEPAKPVLEEEEDKPLSKKELKAKKKAEKAAKKQAELEEEDDDEEGGNALTIIAVIIAAVLVVLLVVILILNFFPDSGAANAIGSVLEKLTGLIAAGELPGGGFLL